MPDVVTTSIADEVGRTAEAPSTAAVARVAVPFSQAFAAALGASLDGPLPPAADPEAERLDLEREVAAALATLPDPDASAPAPAGRAPAAAAGSAR